MFEKSREPIALHWPVIELAPVPGRPMLPVIKCQVDGRLGGLDPLVALVDAHRPPERDALAVRIRPAVVDDRCDVQAGLARHALRVEPADERGELVEAAGVGVDEGPVDRAGSISRCARPYRSVRSDLGRTGR